MNNYGTGPRGPANLLVRFFAACEKEFRFLEQEHGFSYLSGLVQYRKGRRVITSWHAHVPVTPGFEAETLYEKDDTALEILYGGGARVPELYVCYGRFCRFPLEDVLKAAQKPVPPDPGAEAPEAMLQTLGLFVREHADCILQPEPSVIERALQRRERLMEQQIRERFRKDMEDALLQANRALAGKDYRRIVELLTPFEAYLNAVSLKKLHMARKKLLSI